MKYIIGAVVIIILAIIFLRGFDRISGRGPSQISDGIKKSKKQQDG